MKQKTMTKKKKALEDCQYCSTLKLAKKDKLFIFFLWKSLENKR